MKSTHHIEALQDESKWHTLNGKKSFAKYIMIHKAKL